MTKSRRMDWRAITFLASLVAAVIVLVLILTPASWVTSDEPEVDERADVTLENLHEQDPTHQIAVLEKMWAEHPDHSPIALQLANLYFDQGAYPMAIRYYREFLKADTSNSGIDVTLDLARALFEMDRTDDAIKELESMLRKVPDHPGALYNMGAMQANSGKLAEAKKSWQRLIEKHPTDTLAAFAKRSLPMLELPPGHP